MKHILFICHRIPYPPNKGDKIRSFHILKHLGQDHTVSVACLIDDPKDAAYVETLSHYTKSLFVDQFSPKVKKITSLVRALFSSKPITVPYFYSPKVQRELDEFIESTPIDSIFCSSSPSAEYIFRSKHYHGRLKEIKWVMDFIDVDSQKWSEYAKRQKYPFSWIYQREAQYLLAYEKRIAQEFDQLLIVSEAEKNLFHSVVPEREIDAVSNGVDLDFFHPGYQSTLSPTFPALVFTGAMDYWPNIDGAIWFVDKVLPRLREKFPEICFYLVGSNPAEELSELTKEKGVIVTGFVNDVRDYIVQADVCVIPLRIARGIQNKVLEAMAMGKPVVCTPEAAVGLLVEDQNDISLQKDAISFAEAILSLLQDKKASQGLGKNARKTVEEKYTWEKNLRFIDTII